MKPEHYKLLKEAIEYTARHACESELVVNAHVRFGELLLAAGVSQVEREAIVEEAWERDIQFVIFGLLDDEKCLDG